MLRSTLVVILALGATAQGAEMTRSKQEAVPSVFVDGPSLEPEGPLETWLAARRGERALVKLPFTLWVGEQPRSGVTHAAVGVKASPGTGAGIRLDDSALGIPLSDRLGRLCKNGPGRCIVWLEGRFGALIGGPGSDDATRFSVMAVHETLEPGADAAKIRAQVQGRADCLVILPMPRLHCARGPKRCKPCRSAQDAGPSPALIDICPKGDTARPVVELELGGKPEHRVYDLLRRFADEGEARSYAKSHGITDIRLP